MLRQYFMQLFQLFFCLFCLVEKEKNDLMKFYIQLLHAFAIKKAICQYLLMFLTAYRLTHMQRR